MPLCRISHIAPQQHEPSCHRNADLSFGELSKGCPQGLDRTSFLRLQRCLTDMDGSYSKRPEQLFKFLAMNPFIPKNQVG